MPTRGKPKRKPAAKPRATPEGITLNAVTLEQLDAIRGSNTRAWMIANLITRAHARLEQQSAVTASSVNGHLARNLSVSERAYGRSP